MAVTRRTSFAFPRQWNPTQVPSFPVEIDGNKAPRGLILSTTGNSHGRDLTGNYAGIATGSTGVSATPAGVGLTSVSGGVVGYAIPPPLIFSIETYVQAGSALSGGEAVCGWNQSADGSSGTTDRQILGTGVNHYNFNIFPSGSCLSTTASFNDDIVTHIVGVCDGSNSYIYINGVLSNTLPGGLAYTGYTLPAYFVIGNAGSNPWSGKIMLVNVTTAAWTASEVAQRAAAPFAMFRPLVRRTYSIGAAGGTSFTAAPGVGAVTFTGLGPTVSADASLTPGVGSVVFTGLQPTVSVGSNFTATPGVGSVVFTGLTPTVAAGVTASPGVGAVTFTGLQPTVSTGADVTLTPGVGSVVFTGFAPTVTPQDVALTPGTGAILFTGFRPNIGSTVIITPSVGGFDAGGYGKWYTTAFGSTSSSSSRRGTRDTELGQMLDRLVYRDDVADIRADAEPEAAAEIVRSAVTEIKRSRYEINDEIQAIERVKSQQAAYRALMKRRTEEESQRAFIAAVVEQSANEQRVRHRTMRDDEDIMALFELAL